MAPVAPLYSYAGVSLSNVVATTCQYEVNRMTIQIFLNSSPLRSVSLKSRKLQKLNPTLMIFPKYSLC